jgi:arylsulfatase A-like enzyme
MRSRYRSHFLDKETTPGPTRQPGRSFGPAPSVGRLIDSLKDLGILDDTLIFYIIGDNGASGEGTLRGIQRIGAVNRVRRPGVAGVLRAHLEGFGGSKATTITQWAGRMRWTRRISGPSRSHRTGVALATGWSRTGPGASRAKAGFAISSITRSMLLEVAGLPEPIMINGVAQKPIESVNMAYSFNDAKAPERRETQYFEMDGNRGIYHKGWTAVTRYRTPWLTGAVQLAAFDDDVWELYDTSTDWTQSKDLSKENPRKLHDLQRLWII